MHLSYNKASLQRRRKCLHPLPRLCRCLCPLLFLPLHLSSGVQQPLLLLHNSKVSSPLPLWRLTLLLLMMMMVRRR